MPCRSVGVPCADLAQACLIFAPSLSDKWSCGDGDRDVLLPAPAARVRHTGHERALAAAVRLVARLLRAGADKISINSYAVENPKFITDAAVRFGNQSITVSIDAMKVSNEYNVFIRNGKIDTGIKVSDWAKKLERLGAGESAL